MSTPKNSIAFASTSVEQRSFPSVFTHNFYICGTIGNMSDYVDMIMTLDTAQENDEINIFINTPGGNLDTAISIIHAMSRSKGKVIVHADGRVASAGTLIFLAGQVPMIYPYATFFFHDGSEGIVGKVNENLKQAQATSKLVKKMMHDIYGQIFDEDEVEAIVNGSDMYLDAEEMVDRINAASKKVAEEEDAKEQADHVAEMADEIVIDVDDFDEDGIVLDPEAYEEYVLTEMGK